MRKLKVSKWVSKDANGTDVQEDSLIVIKMLINSKKPEDLPRGLDKFRLFNRLSKAFDEAEKTEVLQLEDADYEFIKKIIESDIPAIWGMNHSVKMAIEDFVNLPEA